MNTVFNLRLPAELKKKVEHEAKDNHTSINQYLLYIISKTIAYNDAIKDISNRFKNLKTGNWEKEFNKIPDIKPLEEKDDT
jgi:hypothetical protein